MPPVSLLTFMKFIFPLFFFLIAVLFLKAQNPDSLSALVEQYVDAVDREIPFLDYVLEQNLSDVSICKGPNSTYYMTGTFGDRFGVHDGIKVWASVDLKKWDVVNETGYVWLFSSDAVPWQKEISYSNGLGQRGIIAPKLYYWKDTFWISYTNSNYNKSGILRSRSGRIQGPYDEVSGDKPLIDGVDASLFFDTDSTAYFLCNGTKVYTLNSKMDGFLSNSPRVLTASYGTSPVQLSKIDGKYYLSTGRWKSVFDVSGANATIGVGLDARFDGVVAVSDNLFGSYRELQVTIPHAGGGLLFQDFDKNFWFAFTGNDKSAPVRDIPALMPLQVNVAGDFIPVRRHSKLSSDSLKVVYVSTFGNNSTGTNWDNAYTSIQRAVDNAPDNAQIWIAQGRYNAPVEISLREGISLFGGFRGDESQLSQRNSSRNKVVVNGKNSAKHVVLVSSSRNIRIDGLTLMGGNAAGLSFHHQYGGGAYILGGGETIKLVNCTFENNKADQDGGAIYASVGAAPMVINCTFKNNVSKNNGGAAAVYCNSPNGYHAKFYNCIFDNNFAYGDGGAIYFDSNKKKLGLLSVVNCLIVNNTTLKDGGTLTLDRSASLLMINTTMCFNKGTTLGAAVGSLGHVPGKSRIYNSIFYLNYGGSLFAVEGEAELEKRIADELSPNTWVIFENSLFEANEVNALVLRNFDKKIWKNVSALNETVMGRNCTEGDPLFIDPYTGDFHLNIGSKAKSSVISNSFKFNLDKQLRSSDVNNLGCY
jgi:predicted outer membrane repeat protein